VRSAFHRGAVLVLALAAAGCARRGSGRPLPAPPPPTTAAAQGDRPLGGCGVTGEGRSFSVGPGKRHAQLGDVPFESLRAGDTVQVFWRPEPYREKLMLSGQGTATKPIRICGVPGPAGQLPVLDGRDATTRRQLDFPYQDLQARGVVTIGHPHDRPWEETPRHILFEGFEVRNGAPPHQFTDNAGKRLAYASAAAGVFIERGRDITIRGCVITENNNGIFTASGDEEAMLSRDVLIEANDIHANGSLADYYEHNVYNEAVNVTYQFNRLGAPRGGKQGPLGANIKDRSAGVVIRYNWIEDGAHVLDLVDAQEAKALTRGLPSFHSTYVYGNVIVRRVGHGGGSIVHYGGDSGELADYRKGTLNFYNNTVIVRNDERADYERTAIFELSTNDEHLESRNNVYFSTSAPRGKSPVGMLGDRDGVTSGIASFAGDWVRDGWGAFDLLRGSGTEVRAKISGFDELARGENPGFRGSGADGGGGDDYRLPAGGNPVALAPDVPSALLPNAQYVIHRQGRARTTVASWGALDD
jgi:hypothetical protein